MYDFVGRKQELADLGWVLEQVRKAVGSRNPGQCIQMRGRRRIGKSSLVEEFLRTSDTPAVFYTAERRTSAEELASLWQTLLEAPVVSEKLTGSIPTDWSAAWKLLAAALPDDRPTVVVIDELPYLIERVPAFEGILQRAWDRELSRKPILLILIGSDLAMMEALNAYDRPFHQRGREMIIGPLSPAAVGDMIGLDPGQAFDAALITGGLPLICAEWTKGQTVEEFLEESVANPLSALMVSAERTLAAEFPTSTQAYQVLTAISNGERTFTNIARAADGMAHSSLQRALETLVSKRIVAAELPLSTHASKERRYRITDPYLRFWLTLIRPNRALIERRRADLALERIRVGWTAWRGRAIEPIVRDSLARLLPSRGIPDAPSIGAYWTKANNVEIDVVGADKSPIARELLFMGSIKWLENSTFDAHDVAALHRHRAILTENPIPLIALSRAGVSGRGIDASFDAEDLLTAWH